MRVQTPSTTRRFVAGLAVGALVALTAACGSDDDVTNVDATDVENVVDTVVAEVESASDDLAQTLRDNGLNTIAGIIEDVDISSLLDDETFTFFAPNDDAFTSLGAEQTADLLTDPSRVLNVLRNHALSDPVSAAELAERESVVTEAGETLVVRADGDTVTVGEVTVVDTDIDVGGGVIHVVDGLLLVP
jgi:transforming growth factor-beta-induced protein